MSSKLTIPTLRVFRRYILALLVMTAVFYGCAGETTSTTVEVTRVVEVEKEVKVKGDTVVETVVVEKEVKVKGDTVIETVVVEAAREGMSDADYVASRENCTTENPCHPKILTDFVPSSFSEAPMLTVLVNAGKLPPVEQRIPAKPLVIQPADQIGPYGGIWNLAHGGAGDRAVPSRNWQDRSLAWATDYSSVVPKIFDEWGANGDYTVWEFHIREGIRWSDGDPMTTADYMFWYEHIAGNTEVVKSLPFWMNWGGEVAKFEAVDDYNLRVTFAESFPIFAEFIASSTVGGPTPNGRKGLGMYAPSHYLEQFHADFVGVDPANKLAEDAGFEGWAKYILNRNDAPLNPDLPVMTPWLNITTIADSQWILERNPYYFVTDNEGNQLPYMDRVVLTMTEDNNVLNLNAIAGQYDLQYRHTKFANYPVFQENASKGNYRIQLFRAPGRHQTTIYFNMDWAGDPEIAAFTVDSVDFRKALSMAIDREQINEVYYLGVGQEGSYCAQGSTVWYDDSKWDDEFGVLRVDEANKVLDGLGLSEKDSSGYRLLPSGERLTLELVAPTNYHIDHSEFGEMISQMWKENIGIDLQVQPVSKSLLGEIEAGNEHMGEINVTGPFFPVLESRLLPSTRWGPLAKQWADDPTASEYGGPEWIVGMVDDYYAALAKGPAERVDDVQSGVNALCDNVPYIGTVTGAAERVGIVKNYVRNLPYPLPFSVFGGTPGNAFIETLSLATQER